MVKLLLASFGFFVAFILCGVIGASAVIAGVPALREKCDGGVICYALQAIRIIPSPPRPVVDPNSPTGHDATSRSRCLTTSDRAILYRLGMTLIGSPIADGIEIPTALGLGQADCMPIEEAAKKLCASLGQEWSMGRPVNCEFQQDRVSQPK